MVIVSDKMIGLSGACVVLLFAELLCLIIRVPVGAVIKWVVAVHLFSLGAVLIFLLNYFFSARPLNLLLGERIDMVLTFSFLAGLLAIFIYPVKKHLIFAVTVSVVAMISVVFLNSVVVKQVFL